MFALLALFQALPTMAQAAAVAAVILSAGGVVFYAGSTHRQVKWLVENAATKADVAAVTEKLDGKQDKLDCRQLFLSCQAARRMAEMDHESRLKSVEKTLEAKPSGD